MASSATARIIELPALGARLTALAERAYVEIKQMVLDNRVHGGEYLLEEDLARMVGMSRTPVREALVRLQNEGLIAIVPRRGIRVLPLTVEDIREVHDIMTWLESQAAHALASRADRASCVKELRGHVTEMRRALAKGDLDTWARENDRFHMGLVASAGNKRLARICENLLERTDFKTGFASVPPAIVDDVRAYTLKQSSKFKLAAFYAGQFARNPAYLNSSLLDTTLAFIYFYVIKRNYTNLYGYVPWDEDVVNRTLIDEYDFELAPDTESTWRIGDGAAAFYNYIYHTIAGMTENDTFRSNQIRNGAMTRSLARS